MPVHPTPRPHECIKCGQPHTKCLAHNRQGKPCGMGAIDGADVCRMHGGASPQAQRLAAVRVQEHEARRMLDIEGNFDPISDPYTEMSLLAGEVVRLKNVLREKVEELTTLKDVGGDKVATQIDVLMSAYERGLDRCERILTNMARLDLDGKIAALQARVDEETGAIVSSALTVALSAVTLEPDQAATILQAFGNALRQPALKA